MNVFLMAVAALLLAATAAYAQLQIPRFTAARPAAAMTRAVLISVGIAFGCVAALTVRENSALAALAFVIGFGAVHCPAAFILFVKRERGSGKS